MNFSVTVPEEWLTRRRGQVAEASRKVRAKKKKEEEELRNENAKLRDERAALLNKITDLEERIQEMREPTEDLENELLRAQLDQHKSFILGLLDQVSSVEPSETHYKGELSKQGRDFANMTCLRIIAETQKDQGGMWMPADVSRFKSLQGGSEITCLYRREADKSLLARVDMVIPQLEAKGFLDVWTAPWFDREMFGKMYGDQREVHAEELEEFKVEEEGEEITALYIREPAGSKFRDHVFLTSKTESVLSKSTLQLGPGRGPTLSQLISNQQETSASSGKRSKLADPVDWGICGTTPVYTGVRSTTGHGQVGDSESLERLMEVNIEGIFAWNETIDSMDPSLAGPCTRVIWICQLHPDFRLEAIGDSYAFIEESGMIGEKMLQVLQNYLSAAYALSHPPF